MRFVAFCKRLYIEEIEEELRKSKLTINQDYFLIDNFNRIIFPIISTYIYDKSYVEFVQISLTERCTLKCKKCAHACYAISNDKKDLTLLQVYKSIDSFFKKVDYVEDFVLIGGEPLLYKEIEKVIEYIGEKYINQIGKYAITTNGTIIPQKSVLEVYKKYNVAFSISNYSKQLPRLKIIHMKLINTLKEYGIIYSLGPADHEWMDYGFEYVKRDNNEKELIQVFDNCLTPCREIRENKFYFCVMARSVSENLGYNVEQEDYLDLDKLGENYKEEILKFNLGYLDKGYLDMCRFCNGAEAKNHPIPVAEQI